MAFGSAADPKHINQQFYTNRVILFDEEEEEKNVSQRKKWNTFKRVYFRWNMKTKKKKNYALQQKPYKSLNVIKSF